MEDGPKTFPCPEGVKVVVEGFVEARCPFTGAPDFYELSVEYVSRGKCLEALSFSSWLSLFKDKSVSQEELAHNIGVYLKRLLDPSIVCVRLSGRHGSLDLTVEYCVEGSAMEPSTL